MNKFELELIKNKIKTEPMNIKIISDSMLPLLKINERLAVSELPANLSVFDIIVFYDAEKLICHFVWKDQKKFNDSIITRSLKDPYKNEIPRNYNNIVGWIPSKKIHWMLKIKIILLNWVRGSL